ncbi:glycosyltransferase [Bacteroides gallinaceum]|uniref:Glycosyltransferase n=1 Tax=Bacteroides gallinaceum TaxID=1462571 RepID=A0ABT7X3W1_9BACE|nr:glycosyltransferase [Bacteroides gallinaceum]MDN0048742.1 glycosyltransferase [Bacteroides gallinaceum]
MKNILFLTPHLPSVQAGGAKFTFLLLNELSKVAKIDLIYFKYNNETEYIVPNENINVLRVMKNSTLIKVIHTLQHPFTHPIFSVRFDFALLAFIKHIMKIKNYDLLYLDHSQMFMYGKYFPKIQKILMAHDVMAQRYERCGNWLSKKIILSKEKELMSIPNSTVFTFSEKDNSIIMKKYGIKAYSTDFFLNKDIIEAIPNNIERKIVLMGKWDRPDNLDGLIWFLDKVLSLLDKDIKILIYGKWMPKNIMERIKNDSRIEYLGFVENPYPNIANCLAMISPLFSGAGVKVKVIEALACGTPVIGTKIAFEGISKDFSAFMTQVNNSYAFAKTINTMSISVHERKEFKQKFLQKYHDKSIVKYIVLSGTEQ